MHLPSGSGPVLGLSSWFRSSRKPRAWLWIPHTCRRPRDHPGRLLGRWLPLLARAGSRASSAEPGKDHPLELGGEGPVPRETRRHVFDKPPRSGCSGASGQAFSAQEVWRDEVNGADRVARADERPIGDRIGQDAFAEAVAEIPPRWAVRVGYILGVTPASGSSPHQARRRCRD